MALWVKSRWETAEWRAKPKRHGKLSNVLESAKTMWHVVFICCSLETKPTYHPDVLRIAPSQPAPPIGLKAVLPSSYVAMPSSKPGPHPVENEMPECDFGARTYTRTLFRGPTFSMSFQVDGVFEGTETKAPRRRHRDEATRATERPSECLRNRPSTVWPWSEQWKVSKSKQEQPIPLKSPFAATSESESAGGSKTQP